MKKKKSCMLSPALEEISKLGKLSSMLHLQSKCDCQCSSQLKTDHHPGTEIICFFVQVLNSSCSPTGDMQEALSPHAESVIAEM